MYRSTALLLLCAVCLIAPVACTKPMGGSASQASVPTPPPTPYGAVPSARQLRWHELEMYAFVHFGINTFTGREWGYGDESPRLFNPTDFDADQIVGALAEAGFKGVIVTCKHHDGFCLWPTQTTDYNISASPYQDGQGDMVREFAQACERHGLQFAPYVSPWDRNSASYGTPAYVTDVFQPQIRELITNYGDVFEVWFDGANGGDGYYGGARETRRIDRAAYYGWDETWQMIRDLAPQAVIFSDVGPDVRWIGNEKGYAADPSWATYTPRGPDGSSRLGPGLSDYKKAPAGTRDGQFWMPGECDVSIRPHWFWRENENAQVRTPANLMELYMHSVGRGSSLLLNVPPDRRGRLHENDVASLRAFGRHLEQTFDDNLASDAAFTASHVRGDDPAAYGPQHLVDDDKWSPWVTGDFERTPSVVVDLPEPRTFNMVRLREDIRLGQRVAGVAIDAWREGQWVEIAAAQSIGACRLWRVPPTTTERIRIRVTDSPVCPALSDFGLFFEPEIVDAAVSARSALPRNKWGVTTTSPTVGGGPELLLDGDPATIWHTHDQATEGGLPQSFTVDLGEIQKFGGFSALPRQDGVTRGMVDYYRLEASLDGQRWQALAEGEFSNIRNNPIEQQVFFGQKVEARFVRFTALRAIEMDHAALAEFYLLE